MFLKIYLIYNNIILEMRYIKKYKIFEDSEEEDENTIIPEGFKYSWNDIHESLIYLTDIGFKIDEKSEKRYLADEHGGEVKGERSWNFGKTEYKSNIEKAKNAIYEIKLFKKKETGRLKKEVQVGESYRNQYRTYHLDSDIDGLLAIYEEIASFCSRFDKAYHNLSIEKDGYSVWLVASSDVTQDFIQTKLDKEMNSKIETVLSKQVYNNFNRLSYDNMAYTKKFREEFFGGSVSQLESGIFIKLFNWNSVTKSVYNTNSEKFDQAIKSTLNNFNDIYPHLSALSWNLGKYGYKAEFRELKEEDIVNLKERESERCKKYIGTKAIIVKFDYNKVFDIIKKEILSSK
jgi:hypothetical protein